MGQPAITGSALLVGVRPSPRWHSGQGRTRVPLVPEAGRWTATAPPCRRPAGEARAPPSLPRGVGDRVCPPPASPRVLGHLRGGGQAATPRAGHPMRVVVQRAGDEKVLTAWGPLTLKLGDRVVVEGSPLRPWERPFEAEVVEIGPGSLPVRRVLEVLPSEPEADG